MWSAAYSNVKSSPFAQGFKQGVGETFGWQYGKKGINEGFLGRGAEGGIRANWLGNSIGLAILGYDMYRGYKENGIAGAGSAAADTAISWGVTRGAWSTLKALGASGAAVGLGVAAAAGYGYYKLGQAGIARARRYRGLEMGSDTRDTFGTMSTMRQRSLSAIQNSHVNGRLALGGEASLMHNPIMR